MTITSPAAKITIPADDAHRLGEFDPVTPGVALTGTAQIGEAAKPIDVTLKANEFVTVAVVADGADGGARDRGRPYGLPEIGRRRDAIRCGL